MPQPRLLTPTQERAIRTAMQTFVDDDLAFGSLQTTRRWCVRCEGERPAPGFVEYDCGALCNRCATEYELSRARGVVWTPAEFLGR
jgi:hypothetical protein